MRVGIKRWRAEAENYSQGRFQTFWRRASALKWLRNQWTYDRLLLHDQWTGDAEVIRDKLKDATIIQHESGAVEIIYKDEELGNGREEEGGSPPAAA